MNANHRRHRAAAGRGLAAARDATTTVLGLAVIVAAFAAPAAGAADLQEPASATAAAVGQHARTVLVHPQSPDLVPTAVGAANAERARELVEAGIRHEHAEGMVRDYARAYALYCSAARLDDPDAWLRLGWMYANGRGLPRDDVIANTSFRRAASLGSEHAERLARLIPAAGEALPECLRAPVESASAPEPSTHLDTATPIVEQPAAFRAAPASPDRRQLVHAVLAMAREYRLDPRLVFAVMRAESGFDPMARSAKNAQGLMQLIPETAERFAVRNILDPLENLRGGIVYLRWLLSYFRGDVVLALAGYNAGEGAVDRHRGVPPYAETLAYVQRVRALYPHDRHPFDARVTVPSPWMGERLKTVLSASRPGSTK